MHPISFYFAISLSLIYGAIVMGQIHESTALEKATNVGRSNQIKMLQAQKTSEFAHQLVQRMAVDSAHDPALNVVLKKNGVQVTYNGPGGSVGTAPPTAPPKTIIIPGEDSQTAPTTPTPTSNP